MNEIKKACCSSPSSIRFWLVMSIVAWGLLSALGLYWGLLRPYAASTILLAQGLVVLPTGLRIELFTAASLRRFFSLLAPCFCLRMQGSFTSSLGSSGHLWYLVLRSHFSSNGNMR